MDVLIKQIINLFLHSFLKWLLKKPKITLCGSHYISPGKCLSIYTFEMLIRVEREKDISRICTSEYYQRKNKQTGGW